MSRCQRRIVSGVTSSRSPWRRALGITLSRVAMSARSAQFSFGRCGCRRCRMASWWRRIKISAVFHASSRRDSRSHAAIRVIRRNTSRRNMTVDHYDRMPGRATLLVRAMDGILGTHRQTALPAGADQEERPCWATREGPPARVVLVGAYVRWKVNSLCRPCIRSTAPSGPRPGTS
jgi:hypothetical protein